MSYAYDKAKKARRKSRPKRGHQLREGRHIYRPTFGEKLRALFGVKP